MKIKPVVDDKKTHDVVEIPISTKPVKKRTAEISAVP